MVFHCLQGYVTVWLTEEQQNLFPLKSNFFAQASLPISTCTYRLLQKNRGKIYYFLKNMIIFNFRLTPKYEIMVLFRYHRFRQFYRLGALR